MNTPIKDGGPAFPQPLGTETVAGCEGLSRREYFAAHAPAVPDNFDWEAKESDMCQRLVRWNYHYADAMLKASQA